MRKLLTFILIFSSFLLTGAFVNAQEEVKAEFDSTLEAFVDIDNFSTVEVIPSSNEVGLPSEVVVRVLDRNGNPLSGRTVILYTLDSSGAVVFIQPSLTDIDGYARGSVKAMHEGVFDIRAYDSTYSQGDISIHSNDTLYTFPLQTPILDSEPYYTKGLNNKLYWNEVTGSGVYEYYIEASLDSGFSSIVSNSGWTNALNYEFKDLENGKMYFYRVKARNQGGGESAWSSLQFSVQDNQPPAIKLIDVGKFGGDDSSVSISMKFQVADNLALEKIVFFCVQSDGEWVECGNIENSGSIYTINILLSDLERGPFFSFLNQYSFCLEAFDVAGNRSQNCEAKILLEEFIETPTPVFTNIINAVINRVNSSLQNLENAIIRTLSSMRVVFLDILSILLLILFLILTLFLLTGSIFLIPTILLLFLLKLLSLIGIRGHGKPLGIVYDSVSKKPLQFAVIHIYDNMNRLIRKDVTNSAGEFFGNLSTGRYRIMVKRVGYLYPSQLVKGKEDMKLGSVYRSEYLNVTKKKEINIVVPIDPINLKNPGESSFWDGRLVGLLKSIGFLLVVLGFSIAVYVFQKDPSLFRMFVLLIYVPVIGIYMKVVMPVKWRVS